MAGQISSLMGLTANRNVFYFTLKDPVRSFWQNVFRDPSQFLNWQARVLMQQSCALEVSGFRLFSNALPARNLTRFLFASTTFYTASSVERLDFPGSLRPHTIAKQQISGRAYLGKVRPLKGARLQWNHCLAEQAEKICEKCFYFRPLCRLSK